jgi:hypothetical protein
LRNFVRIADIMPPPACIVGGLMILFSKRGKRLGDLLAGTMVVREDFGWTGRDAARWEAAWIARAEKGRFGKSIVLADVKIEANQMQIIKRFMERRDSLPLVQRQNIAWKVASPFLRAFGEDATELEKRTDRYAVCERILSDILARVDAANTKLANSRETADDADAKREQWISFDREIAGIAKGGARGLRLLRPNHLVRIIGSYRQLAGDVARARSLGRNSALVRRLNNIAIRAHNVLYGHLRPRSRAAGPSWICRFPIAVRAHCSGRRVLCGDAVCAFCHYVCRLCNFIPTLDKTWFPAAFSISNPPRNVSLHNIPGLARPVAASSIIDQQYSGDAAGVWSRHDGGLGTTLILVTNGMQLGAVAGWMFGKGKQLSTVGLDHAARPVPSCWQLYCRAPRVSCSPAR